MISQLVRLIQYRHLLWDLAVKELKVRYRNPILGFLWTILIPLFQIIILKIVFSFIIRVPVAEYPFFIFLMTGFFPWVYFSASTMGAAQSIVGNAGLVKKANFPRQVLPLAVVVANLVHFLIILVVMLVFLVLFKMKLTGLIIYLPLIVLLQTIICVGVALIVSSLQVCLRDTRYILEIALMAWFYLTPIFYPLALVAGISGSFLKAYLTNPLAGLITLYRLVLLKDYIHTLPPQVTVAGIIFTVTVFSLAIFFLGLKIFKKCQPKFFDLL